jgi:hypothetical protein
MTCLSTTHNTMPMVNGTCMMKKITQSLMNGLQSFNEDFAGLLAAVTNG